MKLYTPNALYACSFRNLWICVFLLAAFLSPVTLWANDESYVPDEVLVRYKADTDTASISAFEQQEGLTLLSNFAHIRVRHYKLPGSQSVKEAIQQLSTSPIVESVEPNHMRRPMLFPTDPSFSEQWSLHNTGQSVNGVIGPADVDIDWPEAMDLFQANEEVIVAVIDSGVALDHPEIDANAWINQGEAGLVNGVDDDGNGYPDDVAGWDFFDNDNIPLDEHGHGSLVSSIVAGVMSNGEGGTGVASSAKIMALRAFDDFGQGGVGLIAVSNFLAATTYAANNGARIINASFGGTSFNSIEEAQVQWLDSQGLLVVAAAGNNGDDNDQVPHYPASYSTDNIISVAAINRDDELASFSNFGVTSVDLAAPGTDIYGADVNRFTTYREDFETGAPDWTVGQNPGSQSFLDWSLFVDATGNTWLTDSVDLLFDPIDYLNSTSSWAMSPIFSVPLVGAQLSYIAIYELSLFDFSAAEITVDGINWNVLPGTLIEPSLADGRVIRVDLSAYAEQLVQIRFALLTDSLFVADGVYIDNVEISEVGVFTYDGTQYKYNSGTSFSAPLVSGVAAMIMAQRPDLSHRQVRQLILDTVEVTTGLTGNVMTGGRLNARAALEATIAQPVNSAPVITTDPANQTINEGESVTFTVVATGSPAPTFQWKKDGADIAGSALDTLTINPVSVADAGTYTVVVTNIVDSVTSTPATLTVTAAPVAPIITKQPADQTVDEGDTATFNVEASGTAPLGYQWKKDSIDIPGANSASYITPVTTLADDATTFQVIVTNSAGSVTSTSVTLIVNSTPSTLPTITTQPSAQNVNDGGIATFTVVATGDPTPTYQWERDGTAIPGATTDTLMINPVTFSDAGAYTVIVTNPVGTVTSTPAQLTVAPVQPAITTQPADQSVVSGDMATFTVAASGTAPLSYQWRRDSVDILGATSVSYTTNATTLADDGSSFQVVVTNSVTAVTSNPATLTVTAAPTAPTIITDPISQTVNEGQGATFRVAANGTEPLTYQWQRDGVDILGAISTSYSIPVTTLSDNGATFWVVVGNAAGSATSGTATLIVNPQDSNGDGLSDADAIILGLDPNDPDGDTDNDGLSDVLEIGGDVENPIDSDLDGIIDALEPGASATDATTAAGLSLADGSSVVTISAGGETLSDVSSADASGAPSGISFPFGMLSYTTTSAVGGSVTVRMVFSADLPATMDLYKVDNGVYRLLPTSVWTKVGARSVDITLTDGDPATDLDGVADGSIEDPVAVAAVTPATTPPPTSSGGGGGGGGGCVINARAENDPTFPLLILVSLFYLTRRALILGMRRYG